MKKIYVLIPSLVALSNAPLITLAGCSKKNTELKFSISTETTGQKTASIYLDWKPSGDSIIFTNWKAKSETNPISEVKPGSESRPQQINLTFAQELSQDLNDVTIEFNYYDQTKKTEGNKKIDGICINKYGTKEVEWDFVKNGFYEPTEILTDPQPVKQEEAFKQYLGDIENNPKIFLDEILNTQNTDYFSLAYIIQASIDAYTSSYKIKDLDKDNGTLTITVNHNISYTYGKENIKIKTDLTLTGIKYVSTYFFENSHGKVNHCWEFTPSYFGYGPDGFRQEMLTLTNDWSINGSIWLYSATPETNSEYEKTLEYDWNNDNISDVQIDDEHIDFLNQEYYGIDNSYYYSQCPIECNTKFVWYDGKYEVDLEKDRWNEYIGCDFSDDDRFEEGDYDIQVMDITNVEQPRPIPNLDMRCSLDGDFHSLFTDSNGIAHLGNIQKESYLIFHLLRWPSAEGKILISLIKKEA